MAECLRGLIGDFSAIVTGSKARGEDTPLSDLDLIVFSDRSAPNAELCCWGTPYGCDIIFIGPGEVRRRLEGLSLALIEGLWHGKWACRDRHAAEAERAWEWFLGEYEVVNRGDYFVVRRAPHG